MQKKHKVFGEQDIPLLVAAAQKKEGDSHGDFIKLKFGVKSARIGKSGGMRVFYFNDATGIPHFLHADMRANDPQAPPVELKKVDTEPEDE